MDRNLLFLQQQAMARQAQQQKAAAAAAAAVTATTAGGNMPPMDPQQQQVWMQQQAQQQQQQQQRMRQQMPMNLIAQQQQQQLENENRIKQQKLQQQRLASMYMQQRDAQQQAQVQQVQQAQQLQQRIQLQQQQQQQMMAQQQQAQHQQQAVQQPIIQQTPIPPPPPANATLVQTALQRKNLDLFMGRDQAYQVTLDAQHKRHMELATSKKHDIDIANNERKIRSQSRGIVTFGKGYDGYGNGKTGSNNRVIYPGDNKKRKRHHNSLKLSYETCVEQAAKEEMLVPIRLDVENDGYKIRDTFTWNMNEMTITPDQFAEITCEDLRLPPAVFVPLIATSIKDQIQDYFLNASSMVNDNQESTATPEKNAYEEFMQSKKQKMDEEEQMEEIKQEKEEDEEVVTASKHSRGELRTVIKLDIIVGNRILNDQFEWDITCKKNSPESFANTMATDLGLGGEFKTAIAHSIREQVHVYIKSLLLTGYEFGDGLVENDDLKRSFLPAINSVLRDHRHVEKFTPSLIEVSDAEIAKIEKGRTRESRRKRRGVRNRKGATLPDREPIPTYRTIFASPPEHEMTDDQFLKSMQTLTDTANSSSFHSQRRSAVKARMNIAAEAAGVSLTSGQLVNDESSNNSFSPIVMTGGNTGNNGGNYQQQSGVDIATRPIASKMMDSTWRCVDCGCSPFMTTIIRAGPSGDKTLCNACGLYRYKYNAIRPQNYMDKEIKNDIPHLNDWQNYMAKYRA